ncbi:hypothetical protein [Staphylococcus epidermidis]|uniref:hypothetical protein n=1 Tax=Staphylococcus epidermidis TaxID=1282 RepID=UPI001245DBC6|nr:hypothetical protein [Staphylococcus epidermidis]KAA9316498.1 hypothetical protein F6H98_06340 [Staphylococcus epidermidis]KAB2178802.1 hypothetical protein F9B26_07495 [Staphylococcus epidermidis]MBM6132539.1 hypothetical protein [Staphylococcus epidermidis]MCG7793931.1 hypothetical protein [Staphylococcus epidermidis]MDS3937974.1 hypothetical protein [Staphylococcus epidermidis]
MRPQQREFQQEIQQTKQVGVGAPTKRISARNSTDKASWGWGPNKENFSEKFNRQSKLGLGPQQREFQREIQQTKQVGVGE